VSTLQPRRQRTGTDPFYSPLRYPGGKRKLANFMASLICANQLQDGHYAEAYAGGSSVALTLLYGEFVRTVHINDRDRGVHAFWLAARDRTTEFCRLVRNAKLNLGEWERQRQIQLAQDPDPLDLAFSTFYLNRTNRSGIITGGLIGGKDQRGPWKLDARFNKDELIRRLERIGRWRSRIQIYDLDGIAFLHKIVSMLPAKSLAYLDPPYYVKGQQMLYSNYYEPADHADIAAQLLRLDSPWVVSYDDVPEIRSLYRGCQSIQYGISYSAHRSYRGSEVMFFSNGLTVPRVVDPTRVRVRDVGRLVHATLN
jgi:DNA adenine methylase